MMVSLGLTLRSSKGPRMDAVLSWLRNVSVRIRPRSRPGRTRPIFRLGNRIIAALARLLFLLSMWLFTRMPIMSWRIVGKQCLSLRKFPISSTVSITDPSLSAGISCVMSEERYSDSFEATQQFLGTLVANQAVHNRGKQGDDRNVSSAKGGKSSGGEQVYER